MMKKDREENNLEDLMRTATEDTKDEIVNEPKKKKGSSKVIISTIVGLFVFIGALGAGAFMMNNNGDFEDKTQKPDWVGKEKEEEEEPEKVVNKNKYPIELYSWATEAYTEDFWEQEGIEELVYESLRNNASSFSRGVAWMPTGKESQYDTDELAPPSTNDVEQRYIIEDGDEVENPEFSYALQEDYEKAFMIYSEMFLNPVFGDWMGHVSGDSPKASTIEYSQFRELFTHEWWEDNIENKDISSLPIMAEWDDSEWNYNFNKDEDYKLFFGRIIESDDSTIEIEEVGHDDENQPILKTITPVEYFAFDKDNKVFSIKGELEMTLQSNVDDFGSLNRVILNDVSLNIK